MKKLSMALALTLLLPSHAVLANRYDQRPEVQALIAEMVDRHGFDAKTLTDLFAKIKVQEFAIETTRRPPEKTWTWERYRRLLVSDDRVRGGVGFWSRHRPALRRAEKEYGVPAAIITAIIGVETRYGRVLGKHRIMDSLTTLAFDGPESRRKFFARELREYLLLTKEQGFKPRAIRGSYAGAMGYGQFIPSSYRHYAVDFNGDEKVDLLGSPTDAIGSVANYLMRNGWQRAQPVAMPARTLAEVDASELNKGRRPKRTVAYWRERGYLPQRPLPGSVKALALAFGDGDGREHWLALDNFNALMSYNPRYFYAMAVYQLARSVCTRVGCDLDFSVTGQAPTQSVQTP